MLMLAHLTVMALFFLIELLPVLVKILLNLGPLDAYEKVLKTEEEKLADKVRLERLTERRDAERKSDEDRKKADAASRTRINGGGGQEQARGRIWASRPTSMSPRRWKTSSTPRSGSGAPR